MTGGASRRTLIGSGTVAGMTAALAGRAMAPAAVPAGARASSDMSSMLRQFAALPQVEQLRLLNASFLLFAGEPLAIARQALERRA